MSPPHLLLEVTPQVAITRLASNTKPDAKKQLNA